MLKIILCLLFALTFIASAHAESYTFSNDTNVSVPEYDVKTTWGGRTKVLRGGTANDVVSTSIDASGVKGTISDLNVTINGLQSRSFIDMTFVLVGPDNTSVVLSSNAGGAEDSGYYTRSVDVTFDDQADSQIGQASSFAQASNDEFRVMKEGSYQLSAYEMASFYKDDGIYARLDPVADGYFGDPENFVEENTLAAFNDISANGTWQLLAFDNYATDATSYSGWSISFTTESSGTGSGAVPEPAEWILICFAALGILGILQYRKTLRRV